MSNSLHSHRLQHTRPPCPSPAPGVYSNSCPLSQWYHPSSVVPFSSCLQSFPASGLFKWVSSSHQVAKVLEFQLHLQSFQWTPRLISFRMDWWTGWISLQSKGLSRVFSNTHSLKASILWRSAFFTVQLTSIHDHWKNHSFDWMDYVGKMSLLFNIQCLCWS